MSDVELQPLPLTKRYIYVASWWDGDEFTWPIGYFRLPPTRRDQLRALRDFLLESEYGDGEGLSAHFRDYPPRRDVLENVKIERHMLR
jgi:hypothetical protein